MKNSLIILIVLVLLGGGWWYYSRSTPPQPLPQGEGNNQVGAIPADWKTYRNEQYGFEVQYPPSRNLMPTLETNVSTGVYANANFWYSGPPPANGQLKQDPWSISVVDSAYLGRFQDAFRNVPAMHYKYLQKGDRYVLLSGMEDVELFDQFVATFKFTK